ncbi:hypothetical protein [Pseudoduganella chitinolytica]|uniref:Uncharacterized protein n=1 Tax=Pseudoduganella chitinolytica TaxID=34070 RepID=A0ABY8BJE8_9BURK|nr:hypothetical protein [Pseudoduganella chitinolytica]WEF34374.1 hypothetical protein PX653_06255 [Pseudoduganella chitinolytica]
MKRFAVLMLAAMSAAPTWAEQPRPDPLTELNMQIERLPNAAQGGAFVATILKISRHCQPGSPTARELGVTFARLVQYATPVVPQDVLAKALGLGTEVWMTLQSSSFFRCDTSAFAVRAHELPSLVTAEMRRARDPRQFDRDRISAPMMR